MQSSTVHRQPLWGSGEMTDFRNGELSMCSAASHLLPGNGASIPQSQHGVRGPTLQDLGVGPKPARCGCLSPGRPFPCSSAECRWTRCCCCSDQAAPLGKCKRLLKSRKIFKFRDTCFTELCWFLPNISMNHP